MLKKELTFEDWDGNTVTQTYHFHIGKGELINEVAGDMQERLVRVAKSGDNQAILAEFRALIEMSIGLRDGARFSKTDDIRRDFMESPAYDALIWELFTDTQHLINFINGVFPKEFMDRDDVQAVLRGEITEVNLPESTETKAVEAPKEIKDLSFEELAARDFTEKELLEIDEMTFSRIVNAKSKGNNIPKALLVIGAKRK